MLDFLSNIGNYIVDIINSLGVYGPILGCFLILIESIVPMLPLIVFITINFYAFGSFWGFIISYVLTVIGCSISFFLFRKIFAPRMEELYKKYPNSKLLNKIKSFPNLSTSKLTVILAFPFTPAFVVNIVCGITNFKYRKFLISLIIGKAALVYFSGYIGVTFIEAFSNPEYFIKIIVMLAAAYILSTIINKKFGID